MFVTAQDARAERLHVGTVNVERNRDVASGVFHAMNIARRDECDDRAGGIDGVLGDDQMPIGLIAREAVAGFIFFAAMDPDDAPRNVIVDGGFLSG